MKAQPLKIQYNLDYRVQYKVWKGLLLYIIIVTVNKEDPYARTPAWMQNKQS